MARTMIEIDDEALAEAAAVLGTKTKKDTVNTALREVVARMRRIEAMTEMQEMAARGEVDWDAYFEEQAARHAIADRVAAQGEAPRKTP
jgi:Arc/MetJ family transcription regulator